jgi:Lrp/AsnC family leucine-responsive transcriptional regulator
MSEQLTFDAVDAEILEILQENARTPNAEIARRLNMAASAIFERIRKLEERGVIEGYTARLNPQALGLSLLAYVLVRSNDGGERCPTGRMLAEIPEVLEVHAIAGEDCYLVKMRVADTEGLYRLLQDKFRGIDSVGGTKTTIVLHTVKETSLLRIGKQGDLEAVGTAPEVGRA